MIYSEFHGILNSVSTKAVKKKTPEGEVSKEGFYKLVIESDNIGFEQLKEDAPDIYKMIMTNENQLLFRSINFGSMFVPELKVNIWGRFEDGTMEEEPVLMPCMIFSVVVRNNHNIPTFLIGIQIPKDISGRWLLGNLKSHIKVQFQKPAGLFDEIEKTDNVKITVS